METRLPNYAVERTGARDAGTCRSPPPLGGGQEHGSLMTSDKRSKGVLANSAESKSIGKG